MNDCIRLVDEALDWLVANYSSFRFFVERDVVWTLQSHLAQRARELDLPFVVSSDERSMADIVLLQKTEVVLAINVKYEPASARRVSESDVQRVSRQLAKSTQRGKFQAGMVIVVDEARHLRRDAGAFDGGAWLDRPGPVAIFRLVVDGLNVPSHKERFVEILRDLAAVHKDALDSRKNRETADLCRPDFLWWRLVHDTLIQGNSEDGVRPDAIETLYSQLQYDVFDRLTADERLSHANRVLLGARIRMARKKAQWLALNFEVIQRMGGPVAAKERLLGCSGRQAKIRFLKQTFSGIGDQGARSIMMAAYHEEFRNSIAIDEPINRISSELGLSFQSYPAHEAFLLEVAAASGLEGWELDRLVSEHYKTILEQITPSRRMAARG